MKKSSKSSAIVTRIQLKVKILGRKIRLRLTVRIGCQTWLSALARAMLRH